ncbi:MAG TPA: hypothetical protein PKC40_01410 [Saprospiraceae bacterium]|nr:hypothetical protein [Saprospiraceae bacterium]
MQEESILEKTGESYGYLKEFVNLQFEYLRLEIAERSGKVLSSLITVAVIGLIALIVLLFVSLTAAIFLGAAIGSYTGGFLLISAFYALTGIVVYYFRKPLIASPIVSLVIKEFFD